jgi:hypothetical protein
MAGSRSPPDLIPRRQPRELELYKIEVVLNRIQVAADLIALDFSGCR